MGTRGSVKVGGTAINKIELWDFVDQSEDDKKIDEVCYDVSSTFWQWPYPLL